jgi:hypothetical protein
MAEIDVDFLSSFLGAFAVLQKATTSMVMSVCSPVAKEQIGFHLTHYDEIRYLMIFRKSVESIKFSFKI